MSRSRNVDDGIGGWIRGAGPTGQQREIRAGDLRETRAVGLKLQLSLRTWVFSRPAAMAATTARQNSSSANASPITPTLACWRILTTAAVERFFTRSIVPFLPGHGQRQEVALCAHPLHRARPAPPATTTFPSCHSTWSAMRGARSMAVPFCRIPALSLDIARAKRVGFRTARGFSQPCRFATAPRRSRNKLVQPFKQHQQRGARRRTPICSCQGWHRGIGGKPEPVESRKPRSSASYGRLARWVEMRYARAFPPARGLLKAPRFNSTGLR